MRVFQKTALAALGGLAAVAGTTSCVAPQQRAMSDVRSPPHCGDGDPTNLLGTWTLTTPLPTVVGAEPQGMLMLDAACNISFQLMGHRDPHITGVRGGGKPQEEKLDAQGTVAYFGTYKVDAGLSTLTITAARHSFPNFEGETLIRRIVYTAGSPATLTYTNSSPSITPNNPSTLHFSRQ